MKNSEEQRRSITIDDLIELYEKFSNSPFKEINKINYMTLKEFIIKTGVFDRTGFLLRPHIICNDGFKVSVQASRFHNCMPKGNHNHYTYVEVGFPTEIEPELLEYAENPTVPTDTVYAYVPICIMQSIIEKHGGINTKKTFKTK